MFSVVACQFGPSALPPTRLPLAFAGASKSLDLLDLKASGQKPESCGVFRVLGFCWIGVLRFRRAGGNPVSICGDFRLCERKPNLPSNPAQSCFNGTDIQEVCVLTRACTSIAARRSLGKGCEAVVFLAVISGRVL